MALPSHAGDQNTEALKAGGAAVSGAAAGGIAFAAIGSGGLAIAGTPFTVSAAPFVAAGAVVGLAGYGIFRVFSDPADLEPVTSASRGHGQDKKVTRSSR